MLIRGFLFDKIIKESVEMKTMFTTKTNAVAFDAIDGFAWMNINHNHARTIEGLDEGCDG